LASGVLTNKYIDKVPEDTRLSMEGLEWLKENSLTAERVEKLRGLKKIADDLGTSIAKLAVAWCAKNENVSTVILGASKVHQLQETLTALELLPQLTTEVMTAIDEVLNNKPQAPMF
jgi:aryl-alcohol dehydrogenase-like predicted oxidoreductase